MPRFRLPLCLGNCSSPTLDWPGEGHSRRNPLLQLSVTESQWDAMTPATREMAVEHLHNLQMLEGRDHLIDYVCATYPQYRPGKHHYQIAEKLEAVERGEISRLLIFAPPRSAAKAELVSARFPFVVSGPQPAWPNHCLILWRHAGRRVWPPAPQSHSPSGPPGHLP